MASRANRGAPGRVRGPAGRKASLDLSLQERVVAVETVQLAQVDLIKDLSRTVEEMKLSLEKYRGFWGAVTLIASAIWAAFSLFKDNITGLFK